MGMVGNRNWRSNMVDGVCSADIIGIMVPNFLQRTTVFIKEIRCPSVHLYLGFILC